MPVDARWQAAGWARRSWLGLPGLLAGLELAQGGAVEIEAVGVDQAIEDGLGEGGLVDHRVPSVEGELFGDESRAGAASSDMANVRQPSSDVTRWTCSPLAA